MALIALVHFCEQHGPTLVMTTQILSTRCLLTDVYLERYAIPRSNPQSCANCSFVMPPVEGVKIPVLQSSQRRPFPLSSGYISSQNTRLDSPKTKRMSDTCLSPCSSQSTIHGFAHKGTPPPDNKVQRLNSDQVKAAHGSDPKFLKQRVNTPHQEVGHIPSTQSSYSRPEFPRFTTHDGTTHPIIDSSANTYETCDLAEMATNVVSYSLSATNSDDDDDVDLENIHFQPDSPTTPLSARPAPILNLGTLSTPRIEKNDGIANLTKTIADCVAPEHIHEVVYVSTKEPISPSLNTHLTSVCMEVLSVEDRSGPMVIQNENGCTVAHKFDVHDSSSRGGIRKYALLAWNQDPRLVRPLSAKILMDFDFIANYIISSTAIASSATNPPSPSPLTSSTHKPSSLTSWFTRHSIAAEIGSFLTAKRSANQSIGNIEPPARSLADMVDNVYIFGQLHAALCPLLSLMID